MNYTYLPSSAFSPSPIIIMTTNPASKKMSNLQANPHVSLLVHDWVSHRPPTSSRRMSGGGQQGQPGQQHASSSSSSVSPTRSSLASLLLNLNTSAMSSISATINGSARLVQPDTDEERFYRGVHLDNNTFEGEGGGGASGFNPFGQIAASGSGGGTEDGGRGCFVAGEMVRVIVVDIRDVRISDWKGNVKDWELVAPEGVGAGLLNGVS